MKCAMPLYYGHRDAACVFHVVVRWPYANRERVRSIKLLLKQFSESWSELLTGELTENKADFYLIGSSYESIYHRLDDLISWSSSRRAGYYDIEISDLGAPAYEPLSDWTKVDLCSIDQRLNAASKTNATFQEELRLISNAIRQKLYQMIKVNPRRKWLRSSFESILRSPGLQESIVGYLRKLVFEVNRAKAENLSEGELAVFDILDTVIPIAPEPGERNRLKNLAKLIFEQWLALSMYTHLDAQTRVVEHIAGLLEANKPKLAGEIPDHGLGFWEECGEAILEGLNWPMEDDRKKIRKSDFTNWESFWEWPWLPFEEKDRD